MEPEIQKPWEDNQVFERVADRNTGGTLVLHDGPLYTNENLHMGHALNKILKDIINRYKVQLEPTTSWVLLQRGLNKPSKYTRMVHATTTIFCEEGLWVLRLLVKIYKKMPSPDFVSICQCLMFLNEPESVASKMENLLFGSKGALDGKYDDLLERSFYMVGGIEEVIAKAEKIVNDNA